MHVFIICLVVIAYYYFLELKILELLKNWETYLQVRKQQLELNMEQQTGSK